MFSQQQQSPPQAPDFVVCYRLPASVKQFVKPTCAAQEEQQSAVATISMRQCSCATRMKIVRWFH